MTAIAPRVVLALPLYRGDNHGVFLGICALVASLQRAGVEVVVFDEDLAAEIDRCGECSAEDVLEQVITDFAPTLVGVHVNTPNYVSALDLAKRLHAMTDAPLVAGGPHASVAADCILTRHKEFQYIIRGEADESLPALAWALQRAESLERVPGLSWQQGNSIVHVPNSPLTDVRALPIPNRAAILAAPHAALRAMARSRYQANFYAAIPGFAGCEVASAYASRGCNSGCPFCSPSVFWADPQSGRPLRRVRPVEHLLAELAAVRELGYRAVFFDEPTFPLGESPDWIRKYCTAMHSLDLRWGCVTRVDEIDDRLIPPLAQSGLKYVYFGLETPHEHLLGKIDKPMSVSGALRKMSAMESNGIQCDVSLFFGAPGETDDTIQATLSWIDRNLPRGNAFFSIAAIWPGTPWAKNLGMGAEYWEPDFDRSQAARCGAVWYSETETSIDKFYSNSTGTYHPAFMSVERALCIKEQIIRSGFRQRFSRYARAETRFQGKRS